MLGLIFWLESHNEKTFSPHCALYIRRDAFPKLGGRIPKL